MRTGDVLSLAFSAWIAAFGSCSCRIPAGGSLGRSAYKWRWCRLTFHRFEVVSRWLPEASVPCRCMQRWLSRKIHPKICVYCIGNVNFNRLPVHSEKIKCPPLKKNHGANDDSSKRWEEEVVAHVGHELPNPYPRSSNKEINNFLCWK